MTRVLPKSEKFGVGPDAYEYLLSLAPSLLWVPQIGNFDGVDLSDNGLTPTAQNTGDLTLTSGPYPPRVIGGAPVCEFGGTNGYIDFGDESALEFSTAFTVIVLQNLPDWGSISANAGLIGKYNSGTNDGEWVIAQRGPNETMRVFFGDPTVGNFSALVGWNMSRFALSEWQVMAFTYNTGSVAMYLDGSSLGSPDESSISVPSSLYNGSADFIIGKFDGDSNYLNGSIALAAVCGTALSAGAIQTATELLRRGA
jgi:hypothetical protein